jgi:decaprenyl-phosphate phosphoribosyltransferase
MNNLLKLSRPYQYVKNLFIFLPAFFAFEVTNINLMTDALISFLAFSLIASAVYIINDWSDRKEDALHPTKKNRPIASGKVSSLQAFGFLVILLISGLLLAYTVSITVLYLIIAYLFMNVFYSLKLKAIAIVDIMTISTGFVIRLFVGSEATEVYLSQWIIVITFLLALFLALAKRRDDVLIFLKTEQKMRKAVNGYNLKLLDAAMVMTSTIVILAYIIWSISEEVVTRIHSENLYITAFFVIMGILRYMQITFVEEKSGNPTKIILKDLFIQITLLAWVISFVWILYLS